MPAFLEAWDASVLLWVQENLRTPFGNILIPLWTHLGDHGLLWIVLALVLLCIPKTRRAGALALGGLVFSLLAVNVTIKHLVARPRPWLTISGLLALVNEPDPNSFPSGHTSAAFAAAVAWARTLPRRWMKAVGLVMAALMGLSRLYVGVHFPSDVLCGVLVGLLCGWGGWRIEKTLQEKRNVPG